MADNSSKKLIAYHEAGLPLVGNHNTDITHVVTHVLVGVLLLLLLGVVGEILFWSRTVRKVAPRVQA